jgi:2-methylisocitrate lyase-like PEP mutase family enzyme
MVQARGEVSQLLEVAERWDDRTVPLICSPSGFPEYPASYFWSAGFDVVIHANQMLRAAVQAQQQLLATLADPQLPLSGIASAIVPMEVINAIVGEAQKKPGEVAGSVEHERPNWYEEPSK